MAEVIEYRPLSNQKRWSVAAILSLPVGISSFPLLLHWTLLAPLGVPEPILMALAVAWPLVGAIFCGWAWWHVKRSAGRLRGASLAVAGFVIASLWLAAVVWLLCFAPRPPMGP